MVEDEPGSRKRRWRWAAWLLACVVLALPIWSFRYFPSQDGPTHVANAVVLADYGRPELGAFRTFYELNLDLIPNLFSQLLLAGLVPLVGPIGAEKVFLSACVLLVLPAFAYARRALSPAVGAEFAPLAALPFVYTHFLHLGFYNLAFSTIPLLLFLGRVGRDQDRVSWGATWRLVALALWLYTCHAVTTVFALVALGVVAFLHGWRDLGQGRPQRALMRLLALAAVAAAPLLLLRRFLAHQTWVVSLPGDPLSERILPLLTLRELASYDPREQWLTAALAALLLVHGFFSVAAAWRQQRWPAPEWLGLFGAAVLLYFSAGETFIQNLNRAPGGDATHLRLSIYVYLVLLLWLTSQPMSRLRQLSLVAPAVLAGVGLIALRLPRYSEIDTQLREYASVGVHVEPGSTLLAVSYAHYGHRPDGSTLSWRILPFLHASGYVAAERKAVDFLNYEADLGYFPTVFREGANPYALLGGQLEHEPPCLDFGLYEANAPLPLDFILVFGLYRAPRDNPCVLSLFDELDRRYALVATSRPKGMAQLYRRHD